METRLEHRDGTLVVFITGRLDAFGAHQLNDRIRESLHDDDRMLVLDLAGAPYLSSGGIRVFLALRKEMERRKGRFILTAVPDYPEKVLVISGFTSVLEIFPSVESALADILRSRQEPGPVSRQSPESLTENGISIAIGAGSTNEPALHIIGNLNNVLYAQITEQDIQARRFSEIDYSLGLGALGASVADAMPLLGEMITLHGSMVWLPTDGHNTPDFLTPQDPDRGDVVVYTGFAVTLIGQFNEYFTIECSGRPPVSMTELYRLVFSLARRRRPDYRGVVAIALLGIIDGLASTGIKKSPVRSSAPKDGSSIMSEENLPDWIAADTGFSYDGDTIAGFGIGIDLTHDLAAFDPADIRAVSYINPANRGSKEMYLHTHGVVFRNVPYDPFQDLSSQIRTTVTEGEFVDMRHLLDTTRLTRAKIGIAYIRSIRQEP